MGKTYIVSKTRHGNDNIYYFCPSGACDLTRIEKWIV